MLRHSPNTCTSPSSRATGFWPMTANTVSVWMTVPNGFLPGGGPSYQPVPFCTIVMAICSKYFFGSMSSGMRNPISSLPRYGGSPWSLHASKPTPPLTSLSAATATMVLAGSTTSLIVSSSDCDCTGSGGGVDGFSPWGNIEQPPNTTASPSNTALI